MKTKHRKREIEQQRRLEDHRRKQEKEFACATEEQTREDRETMERQAREDLELEEYNNKVTRRRSSCELIN